MSFIHYTLVGHFDPRAVNPRSLACARPIDPERVARLLAEYPAEVAKWVTLQDGYARCEWAPLTAPVSDMVFELAYRLVREEGAVAIENGREVTYPPAAARAWAETVLPTGDTGFADRVEARARRHAESFDEELRRR